MQFPKTVRVWCKTYIPCYVVNNGVYKQIKEAESIKNTSKLLFKDITNPTGRIILDTFKFFEDNHEGIIYNKGWGELKNGECIMLD